MPDQIPETLPTLDESVIVALEFFAKTPPPAFMLPAFKRPFVAGSGNALATGRILFSKVDAVFGNESTYEEAFTRAGGIDGAVVVSASGGKSSVAMTRFLAAKLPTILLTNTEDSLASAHAKKTLVFPKIREPYTYNVSTYLGMILAWSEESAEGIEKYIIEKIVPLIPKNLGKSDALFFVVPPEFDLVREMLLTKCDELFGPLVSARAYTPEEAWHSKTIVSSPTELFIHFGKNSERFGEPKQQLVFPLPEQAGFAAMVATSYFVIGRIQAAHPPYFKENLAAYVKKASEHYGHDIPPIIG